MDAVSRTSASEKGYGTLPRAGVHFHFMSVLVLVLTPFSFFLVNSVVFTFMCYYPNLLAYMVFFFFLAVSILLMSLPTLSYKLQGGLAFLACFGGFFVGQYTYGLHTSPWWSISKRITYTNVLPSEPGATKADGGLISFAEGTYVDSRRSLGHHNPVFDKTNYCVAPVMDDTMLNSVNFWAIGHDCCDMLWGFHCGQPQNPKARAGLVYFESDGFFAYHDYARFEEAAKQAAAFYNLVSVGRPVFVTWVEDPEYEQAQLWNQGLMWLLTCNLVYLAISHVVGILAHFASKGSVKR